MSSPTTTGIAFTEADGQTALCAFSRDDSPSRNRYNNTYANFAEVQTGIAPFGVVVSGNHVLVSDGPERIRRGDEQAAPSSGTMVLADPRHRLPRGWAASTVMEVEPSRRLRDVPDRPRLLHEMAVVQAGDLIAVANGHSDSVSLIRTTTLERVDVKVPTYPDAALGSQPIGLAFSPDGKRLYVACGGNNAVAVLEPSGKQWKVTGAIPTAWFPSRRWWWTATVRCAY